MILLRILLGLLALILLLLLTAVIHTLLTPSRKSAYVPVPEPERAMIYARKLSRMIQTETVSRPDTDLREKFLEFHRVLEELFPLVHQHLEKGELRLGDELDEVERVVHLALHRSIDSTYAH